jgi:hypothetical protein
MYSFFVSRGLYTTFSSAIGSSWPTLSYVVEGVIWPREGIYNKVIQKKKQKKRGSLYFLYKQLILIQIK